MNGPWSVESVSFVPKSIHGGKTGIAVVEDVRNWVNSASKAICKRVDGVAILSEGLGMK